MRTGHAVAGRSELGGSRCAGTGVRGRRGARAGGRGKGSAGRDRQCRALGCPPRAGGNAAAVPPDPAELCEQEAVELPQDPPPRCRGARGKLWRWQEGGGDWQGSGAPAGAVVMEQLYPT